MTMKPLLRAFALMSATTLAVGFFHLVSPGSLHRVAVAVASAVWGS